MEVPMTLQQSAPSIRQATKPRQRQSGLQRYDQVIQDIAAYVYHYEVDDKDALRQAQTLLLDAIGCAIETVHKSGDCRRMFGPWSPDTVTTYGCRVPGTTLELDPVKGAFDIATAIRFLDHNDAIAGADWGHPSDNLGAILAVMDWLSRSKSIITGQSQAQKCNSCGEPSEIPSSSAKHHSDRGPPLTIATLLTALVKAYEIQGQFLLLNGFNEYGVDHVILVKVASTAVVSWLLGLTEEQCAAAISHAFMDGHPGRVYRSGANTVPRKGWAAGEAASKAVQLALLVRNGQAGSPTALTMPRWGFYETLFGGNSFKFAFDDENQRPQSLKHRFGTWVVKHTFIKTMPVEGHAAGAVEAALMQSARLNYLEWIDPELKYLVKKIHIRTTAAANLIINKPGPLHNAADRDHSMQYVVGIALLKGQAPVPEDYQDNSPWAQSKDLQDLMRRIEITTDKQLTDSYMNLEEKSIGAAVSIEMDNGLHLDEIVVKYPLGHFANKGTPAMVDKKFKKNMSLMFGERHIGRVVDVVQNALHLDVSLLAGMLVPTDDNANNSVIRSNL